METSQIELEKLSKQKLIEIIYKQEEKRIISEECKDLLRRDLERF